jgi:hypothetical protein
MTRRDTIELWELSARMDDDCARFCCRTGLPEARDCKGLTGAERSGIIQTSGSKLIFRIISNPVMLALIWLTFRRV